MDEEEYKYIPIDNKIKAMIHYVHKTFKKPEDLKVTVRFSKEKSDSDMERVVAALFDEVVKSWCTYVTKNNQEEFNKYSKAAKVFDDYCEMRKLDIEVLCLVNDTFKLMVPSYANKNGEAFVVNC